jgi:hypothetical protein
MGILRPIVEALVRTMLDAGAALHQNVENEAILVDGPPEPMLLPPMEITTSSRCHLSPSFPAERLQMSLANCLPNFSAHRRTVWWETMMPRAASISSTIRKLSGKRKYSQTVYAIT